MPETDHILTTDPKFDQGRPPAGGRDGGPPVCQHRGVATLYDELGVAPTASHEELHRAYRRRARELHPDVSREDESGAAIRRLNEVWSVLGDPDLRREYDALLSEPHSPAVPGQPASASPGRADAGTTDSFDGPALTGLFRVFRPAVFIPAVLLIIFVVTAYAGHTGGGGSPPGSSTPASTRVPTNNTGPVLSAAPNTVPAAALVGRCIQDHGDSASIVDCSQRPSSLVVATVPAAAQCPSGATGYMLPGQSEMVCAVPNRK